LAELCSPAFTCPAFTCPPRPVPPGRTVLRLVRDQGLFPSQNLPQSNLAVTTDIPVLTSGRRVWDRNVGDGPVTCTGLDRLSACRCQMPGQAAPDRCGGCCQISSHRPLACWQRRVRM